MKLLVHGLMLAALLAPGHASAQDTDAASHTQSDYYAIEPIPTPEGAVFEATALTRLPGDRVGAATRRGDVFIADGVFGPVDAIRFSRFATGLEEPMGLVERDGWTYASERTQVVRMKDTDADGRADIYETFCDDWGNTNRALFEWTWLSPPDADGNFWVVLTLSQARASWAYLRGWAVRVTPDGEMIPSAAGIRSPGGIGYDHRGNLFYTDNQGYWNGSNGLKHLTAGSHQGNPHGNVWFDQAKADLKAKGLPDTLGDDPGEPDGPTHIEEERERNPKFVPPAVVFPFDKVGRSPTAIVWDSSEGKFGPFAGQVFVAEITHSQVQRVFLEEVNGVQQGAVFPFLDGFASGPVGATMTPEGFLFTGETSRGWGARGPQPFAFERVRWTGETPFEIHEIRIEPDGFTITFTRPVDPDSAAALASYALNSWTYWLQEDYGSPEIDPTKITPVSVEVADDGMSVRLRTDQHVKGHVHEIRLDGIRSASDPQRGLWHPVGYYTVNEIPAGDGRR